MSDMRDYTPDPSDIDVLCGILEDVPGVERVGNAEPFTGGTDTRRDRNVLVFFFKGYQFFARPSGGVVTIEKSHTHEPVVRIRLDDNDFAMVLVNACDAVAPPHVVVTEDGDAIHGDLGQGDSAGVVNHCIFTHAVCGGAVDICDTTPTLRALRCRKCGLRVTFPRSLENLGELRAYFRLPQVMRQNLHPT